MAVEKRVLPRLLFSRSTYSHLAPRSSEPPKIVVGAALRVVLACRPRSMSRREHSFLRRRMVARRGSSTIGIEASVAINAAVALDPSPTRLRTLLEANEHAVTASPWSPKY